MIEYDFLWLEEYAGELIVVHLIFLSLCTLFLWIIARRLGGLLEFPQASKGR